MKEDLEVCLITKDPQREYKDLLDKRGARDLVDKVSTGFERKRERKIRAEREKKEGFERSERRKKEGEPASRIGFTAKLCLSSPGRRAPGALRQRAKFRRERSGRDPTRRAPALGASEPNSGSQLRCAFLPSASAVPASSASERSLFSSLGELAACRAESAELDSFSGSSGSERSDRSSRRAGLFFDHLLRSRSPSSFFLLPTDLTSLSLFFVPTHSFLSFVAIASLVARSQRTTPSQVIGVSKLRAKFKPYEAKRLLLKSYDLFLADDRVLPVLPSLLGKKFFEKKKQPVPIDLSKGDLRAEVESARRASYLFVAKGSSRLVRRRACEPSDSSGAREREGFERAKREKEKKKNGEPAEPNRFHSEAGLSSLRRAPALAASEPIPVH